MYASSTTSFDLTDINGQLAEHNNSTNRQKGFHVSVVNGFILAFLAIILAVLVGIIVSVSSGSNGVTCQCDCGNSNEGGSQLPNVQPSSSKAPITTTGSGVPDICKTLAQNGNAEVCGLCQSTTTPCPGPATETTHTETEASTTSTPTTPPNVIDYRLPTALKPIHYDVILRPELYNNEPNTFNFSGTVHILVECVNSTDNVTLHINKLNITSPPTVSVFESSSSIAMDHVEDDERQFLIIKLSENLEVGKTYSVNVSFIGLLTDDLEGFYRSSYVDENGNRMYLGFTQFQPTDARRAFPCFDEPAMKATFSMMLDRKTDSEIQTLANMERIDSMDLGDGYTRDVFKKSVIMSTYLVAFAFHDFLNKTKTSASGTEFRTFSRPEFINFTEYALDIGVELLDALEDYFDIEYNLSKLDNIAVPDFSAGAMENWGLVTYYEQGMLYEHGVTTTGLQEWTAEVVCHELAHKWFGNLVSPTWWNDLWLNEGYATFLSYLGVQLARPEYQMFQLMVMRTHQYVMNQDGYSTSGPIYRTVGSPAEINRMFNGITYSKGSAVIRMMWFFMGNETFRTAHQEYLKAHEYSDVSTEDLWKALTDRARKDGKDLDIGNIMDTWIYQSNYPVVNVSYDNTGTITLTQNRFLYDADKDNETYMWEIPFTYTTSDSLNFNQSSEDVLWIHKNETEKTITDNALPTGNNGWIIGNIQEFGYYRVTYSRENWDALTTQLMEDHTKIHLINRAELIDDAGALVRAGILDLEVSLNTLRYLQNETEYMPWLAALSEINYLDGMLESTASYGNFEDHRWEDWCKSKSPQTNTIFYVTVKKFVRSKLENHFKALNISTIESRSMPGRFLASIIYRKSCHHHLQECEDSSMQLFNDWKNKQILIQPDIKQAVTCTAVREGDIEEWEYMYQVYNSTSTDTSLALTAMGCSKRHWILGRMLDYSLQEDKLRARDIRNTIVAVARNPYGFHQTWKFVMENWTKIIKKNIGSGSLNSIITSLADGLRTEFEKSQLLHWKDSIHPADQESLSGFDEAVSKIDVNKKWFDNNFEKISVWLNEQTNMMS